MSAQDCDMALAGTEGSLIGGWGGVLLLLLAVSVIDAAAAHQRTCHTYTRRGPGI
jgi:hypothetical protein